MRMKKRLKKRTRKKMRKGGSEGSKVSALKAWGWFSEKRVSISPSKRSGPVNGEREDYLAMRNELNLCTGALPAGLTGSRAVG
jgi:hypothetical protein